MRTIVNTHGQIFGNNSTAARACLRCAPGVNEHHQPTSMRSFVGGELHELTPGYIRYTAADGLAPIDLHALNVQVFKGNELVLIDQLARLLVRKVFAPVGRTFVGMAKGTNYLAALRTAFGKLLLLALQAGNIPLVLFHPTLAGNLLAVTQESKGGQAKVHTDNVRSRFKRLGLNFAGETRIPVANTISPDRQCLALADNRPVQIDPQISNLGETQLAIVKQSKAALRKGETIVATRHRGKRGYPTLSSPAFRRRKKA